MKRWTACVIIALVASFLCVIADETKESKTSRKWFVPKRVTEKLNLTDEQKANLEELQLEYEADYREWWAEHKDEHDAIEAQKEEARVVGDTAKVNKLEQKRRELFEPARKLRQQYREKFREYLTDEQKATFDTALPKAKSPD
jgi:Spy/CpxP family protein refolding chaperone